MDNDDEIERRAISCALHEVCHYLNADREAHMKAHGSWMLDAGKLQSALERELMLGIGSTAEEDLVAWEADQAAGRWHSG